MERMGESLQAGFFSHLSIDSCNLGQNPTRTQVANIPV